MRSMSCTLAITAVAMAASVPPAHAEPDTVIVVRHAERSGEPASDPALSAAGQQRARQLAEHLAGTGLAGIVTTAWRRARETAEPAAQRFGIEPRTVPTRGGDTTAHVAEVVAAVRQMSGVVLVVGHSNTVAAIVAGLSSAQPQVLCETSFGHLFTVNPATQAMQQQRYGAADPPAGSGCQ